MERTRRKGEATEKSRKDHRGYAAVSQIVIEKQQPESKFKNSFLTAKISVYTVSSKLYFAG